MLYAEFFVVSDSLGSVVTLPTRGCPAGPGGGLLMPLRNVESAGNTSPRLAKHHLTRSIPDGRVSPQPSLCARVPWWHTVAHRVIGMNSRGHPHTHAAASSASPSEGTLEYFLSCCRWIVPKCPQAYLSLMCSF